jgi:hypothetical protein
LAGPLSPGVEPFSLKETDSRGKGVNKGGRKKGPVKFQTLITKYPGQKSSQKNGKKDPDFGLCPGHRFGHKDKGREQGGPRKKGKKHVTVKKKPFKGKIAKNPDKNSKEAKIHHGYP